MATNPMSDMSTMMVKALENVLREKLTKHFEQQAAPIISELVQECVREIDINVKTFREAHMMRDVVHFILTDKTSKKQRSE